MEEGDNLSRKRVRGGDSVSESTDSPEVKRLKEDLLSLLEESPADTDPPTQDLDSFIKIFENEIAASSPSPSCRNSDSGDFKPPELEPSQLTSAETTRTTTTELVREEVDFDSSRIGEFWEFDDSVLSYEPFEFGDFSAVSEYPALDGLFQCSDTAEVSFRRESMPAEERNVSV